VRAILLCAGRGLRFRPVTERIPKPLLPFLNVPLAVAHLRRLHDAGFGEVAINLHHLADEVERDLRQSAAGLPELTFFREPQILGTAGALRNAAEFLAADDFLVVNSDAALSADYAGLLAAHRASGRAATLLVVENREPERYTPLQAEGDRIASFGVGGPSPLLYTGVCVLAPRLLARIPPGETALVAHLWQPLLDERSPARQAAEEIGWVLHTGSFADLGRPRDFLRASLEALASGGPFPPGSGAFDRMRRVLHAADLPADAEDAASVIGDARIRRGAAVVRSAIWSGCDVGERARLEGCLLARGRVPAGAHYRESLLWADTPDADVAAVPL